MSLVCQTRLARNSGETQLGVQRDVDRINFVLAAYMRTRLCKIRDQALYLSSQQQLLRTRLSVAERVFCEDMVKLLGTHLAGAVLDHIPPRYKQLSQDKAITAGPKLDTHVFVILTAEVPDFSVGSGVDELTVNLEKGDCFVMAYSTARPLIEQGKARLM